MSRTPTPTPTPMPALSADVSELDELCVATGIAVAVVGRCVTVEVTVYVGRPTVRVEAGLTLVGEPSAAMKTPPPLAQQDAPVELPPRQ